MTFHFVLIALVLGLSACVAPQQAMRDLPEPETLDEVADLLRGASATIHRFDGSADSDARRVSVAPDSVRYYLRRGTQYRAVATSEVAGITRVRGRGTRYGATAGLIPGALLIFSGIVESGSRRDGQREAGTAALAVSVPVLLVGGAVGAWLGQLTTPGETITVYRGPVARYRQPGDLPASSPGR